MQACAGFHLAYPDIFRRLELECAAYPNRTKSDLSNTVPLAAVDMLTKILISEKVTRKAAAALDVLGHLTSARIFDALRRRGEPVLLTSKGGKTHQLATVMDHLSRKGALRMLGISDDQAALGATLCSDTLAQMAELMVKYMSDAEAGTLPACARARPCGALCAIRP